MKKIDLIKKILNFNPKSKKYFDLEKTTEFAPTNFALIKYWGKSCSKMMIPLTDSISVSLANNCGTTTSISISETNKDILIFDDKKINKNNKEYQKIFEFIDMFRPDNIKLKIETKNSLPKSSGFATSASGYSALTLALNSFFKWNLDLKSLSIFARFGSISASRSIYKKGIVRLTKKNDELFTHSYQLPYKFDGLCVGILKFNNKSKKISSTDGMQTTFDNSILYKLAWEKQVEHDIELLIKSLKKQDWELFKKTIQNNCLAMHATAISAGVIYWSNKTLKTIKYLLELQKEGVDLCFTEDAGEHIKIIARDKNIIEKYFPNAMIYDIF